MAHVTQCPYCSAGTLDLRSVAARASERASEQEIMEAIWVAAETRAGGAYAHSAIALDALTEHDDRH
jgi:alkylhydroperoxidase/carboxymuconolactone decarboxylase family protein YurZ